MIAYAVFAIGLAAAAALAVLLVSALLRHDFAFWPPPRERCWQDYAFWGLFRLYCAAIVLTALLDPGGLGWEHWSRLALGLPVLVAGTALTLHGYRVLGIDNTYGERAGLVTDGLYAYSRNPQYVASVAATLGLALSLDSPLTLALATILLGLYALFALNEEDWLRVQYGKRYAAYAATVPRFLDLRSVLRAYERLVERAAG